MQNLDDILDNMNAEHNIDDLINIKNNLEIDDLKKSMYLDDVDTIDKYIDYGYLKDE